MKELNARLIISDFDKTLTDSQNRVPEKVRTAVNEYIENGGIFAVITGRILPSILPRVRELGLKGLVVACQGTVIADIESGKIIKNGGFNGARAAEICAALENFGANVNLYSGDNYYTDIAADNPHLKLYEEMTGVTALHSDLPLSRFAQGSNLIYQKVASLCAAEDRQPLYEKMHARFSGRFDVTCSADVLVEISPVDDNKGEALKFLAARYGVPIEKTVAVGDNLNDLSMIEAAGIGVAVGNAAEELKQKADYITVSSDLAAVAKVIEKFGYKH